MTGEEIASEESFHRNHQEDEAKDLYEMDEVKRNKLSLTSPCLRVSVVNLKLAEEICDFGLGPVHRADKLPSHHAIAVDDISLREFERAIKPVALAAGIAHRKQAHVVIFHELLVSALVHVNAHRQHGHALVLKAPLHFHQRRKFLHAWSAPRRPEVEDYNLPVKLTERHFVLRILHRELWRSRPNAWRPRRAIASRKRNQKNDGNEIARKIDQALHPDIIIDSCEEHRRERLWKSDRIGLALRVHSLCS